MKNKEKDIEGIENHEHFIDIFKEIDILKDNLTENTDTAFEILKMFDKNDDQESVDVLRITCSNILDCEQLAKDKIGEYETLKEDVLKNGGNNLQQKQALEILKNLKKLETSSTKQFNQLLNLSSSIK